MSNFANLPGASKGPILPGQVVWHPADKQVVPTEPEEVAEEAPEAPAQAPIASRPFALLTATGAGLFLVGLLLIVTPHALMTRSGQGDRFAYLGVTMGLIGTALLVVGIYRAGLALQRLTQSLDGPVLQPEHGRGQGQG